MLTLRFLALIIRKEQSLLIIKFSIISFSKEVSSSVPILECDLGIGHQVEDDEEVVRVREHDLPCVEAAYSSEGGNPLDREEVVDHDHPMVAPLLGEGAELLRVVDLAEGEDHLLVVPCGEDGRVVAAPLGVPYGEVQEVYAWVPLVEGDPGSPHACGVVLE